MMSPMAPRRTTRSLWKRGTSKGGESVVIRAASRFSRGEPRADDFRGRVVFGVADDDDPPSARFHLVALGNALRGVISSLGVEVRADFADDRADILLREDHDRIDVRQRSEDFRAFFGGHHRPAFPFQDANGIVGVDGNYHFTAE